MTSGQKKIILFALLFFVLMLVFGLFFLLAPKALRSYCRNRGVEYKYATCSFRLPGMLSLSGFELRKAGTFTFSAEQIDLTANLWPCLFGRWNVKTLAVNNASMQVARTQYCEKMQLSKITLELKDVSRQSRSTGKLMAAVDEIILQNDAILKGGNLDSNCFFELSKEWLFDHLQGQVSVAESALSRGKQPLGLLSSTVDYAVRQDSADSWQLIPSAGESLPLNQIRVDLSGREVLHAVGRSGFWKREAERQEARLELTASCIDSDPLLALFAPTAYVWVSGRLKYLQLDLYSHGGDTGSFLRNIQGNVALDIEHLHLKNSPFIQFFSRRTNLDLAEILHFDKGSAILKIADQNCQVLTTTPFQGLHPVIEANGTVTFAGGLELRLDLGFSQKLEKVLATKRYFTPFATLCQRRNGYLMLPGSLTLVGTLQSPSVDLTDLLKVSAKAGLKNLFEDAAGRIGIRLQRLDKNANE